MNLRKPRPGSPRPPRAKALFAVATLAFWGLVLVQGCASTSEPAAPVQQLDGAPSRASEATAAPSVSSLNTLDGVTAQLGLAEKQLDLALQGKDERGTPLDTSSDKCSIVCRALASMRDSAKHICELAADRCDAANERVRQAEERARGGCPVCATPS